MSTNDVPGANPANRDELGMGCWAEAADGSLILVESTEGNRVIFSVFDVSRKDEPVEYRSAMTEADFKKNFSWKGGRDRGGSQDKWTWHDKTPFDWDRVMKAGFVEGQKPVSASDTLSAADRVARSLRELGITVNESRNGDYSHRTDQTGKPDVGAVIMNKIGRAINELLR